MSQAKSRRTKFTTETRHLAHTKASPSSSRIPPEPLSAFRSSGSVPSRIEASTQNTPRKGFSTSHRHNSNTRAGSKASSSTLKPLGSVRSARKSGTIGHSISPQLNTSRTSKYDDIDCKESTQVARLSCRRESPISDCEETEEVERVLSSAYDHDSDPPMLIEITPQTSYPHRRKSVGIVALLLCMFVATSWLWREEIVVPEFVPVAPPIPLQYMAWSISSNAMYLRDAMLSVHLVQQIDQVEFNTIALVRFAAEIETIGNSPPTANRLRDYVNLTKALRVTSSALNVRAGIAFRDITRDLSKADKLLKRLYLGRGNPAQPLNLEVEAQLLRFLDTFLISVLPTELRAVSSRYRDAGIVLRKVSDNVRQLEDDLATNGNELARRLEIIPMRSIMRMPVAKPLAQRRKELYQAMIASFERSKEVEGVFLKIEWALSVYSRSLPLFQSPKEVRPDHRASNATLQGILNQIDDVMPQLHDLVQLY